MKDITLFINEAVSKKFDYWKDVIQFPGYELKVPKKYIKEKINSTRYYKEDFLTDYFGWLNQWIDKNAKKIVQIVTKENKDFPKEISIKLPSELGGSLKFDWDCGWTDNVPHGSLRDVELKVNNVSPSSMSHSSFYQAQEDLQHFKLNEQIKF